MKPALRKKLGLLLAEKQKELAVIGPTGTFGVWLRYNQIPLTTAYRLIAQAKGQPTQTDVPTGTIKIRVCGQNWELFGDVLVIRMTPKHRETFRAAVEIWEKSNPEIDLREEIVMHLTRLIPTEYRGPIYKIDPQPDSEFTPASYPAIGWPDRTPPSLPPGRVDHVSGADAITRKQKAVRGAPNSQASPL